MLGSVKEKWFTSICNPGRAVCMAFPPVLPPWSSRDALHWHTVCSGWQTTRSMPSLGKSDGILLAPDVTRLCLCAGAGLPRGGPEPLPYLDLGPRVG